MSDRTENRMDTYSPAETKASQKAHATMQKATEQAETSNEQVEELTAEAQEKRDEAQSIANAGGNPDEAEALLADARALEEKADRKQELQASYARRAEEAEAEWRETIRDERKRLQVEARKEAAKLESAVCDAMENLQAAIDDLEAFAAKASPTNLAVNIPELRTVNAAVPTRLPSYVKRTRERVSKILD
ncbi:hypothetical protein CRI94_17325 [Longibacter salinarum]|uniref:Nucleotide exchange factor GrpE n=1 Tax=Longibacter salinarum TaxID=1850348 RepID=A0A2A8CTD6_9BACT|nr:hypothetical protein [Longibacter salinarum]PEN10378.1 hypothetical protein CRI94_17325 [Longibacter salinarum]